MINGRQWGGRGASVPRVGDLLFGLVGSGEFEPWARDVDRWLLERSTGDGRVLVAPTASAPEGDDVFDGWAQRGVAHFTEMGVRVEVLDVRTRDDAERVHALAQVKGASFVYFSGGNPAYLARTLVGTPLWDAIRREMTRGMVYAGCSAGMACLGRHAPDSDVEELSEALWQPGLGVFPTAWLGPHWDALDRFAPGLVAHIEATVPDGEILLGVDEYTAVLGDGTDWTVAGVGAAHARVGGVWHRYGAGDLFHLPLLGPGQ
jgi:cyanophycinase